MAELRERLIALAEPLLADLGYELVDIEYVPGRGQSTVRVYIDWPGGIAPAGVGDENDENRSFEGIGVDDCEKVSREFSALLDVEDPIPGAYTLEVSSPGMDRILRTGPHYQRFVGERVHVELHVPRDGRRRYTGRLVRADEDGIELEVDGAPVTMSIAEIGKARLAPDWQAQSSRR
ncbi:MAG: ribosome maturation factor RimP [Pseudomonadota bacterium]